MAVDINTTGTSVEQLQQRYDSAMRGVQSAQDDVADTIKKLNDLGLQGSDGKPLNFNNISDWKNALANAPAGGLTDKNGAPYDKQQLTIMSNVTGQVMDHLTAAKAALDKPEMQFAQDLFGPMEALKKLLQTGDIEGAVMLLQTTRARLMDSQLGTQITAMQNRNQQITKLNNDLTAKQTELAKVPTDSNQTNINERERLTKEVGTLKTSIDTLNSDSQIDMIRTQSLVNKRNEAFDTLTNLLGKFQKTIDGIVGNYR